MFFTGFSEEDRYKGGILISKVFVHRDFMPRNLMLVENAERLTPGIIDFQDAVYGPITYDVVSLFRDAFISWEEEQELDWVVRYWEKARAVGLPVREDFGDFWREYVVDDAEQVVMGSPMTSDVFSLKALGDSTRKGWMSRISCPRCGLQSIQMTSCRSGTQLLPAFTIARHRQPAPP